MSDGNVPEMNLGSAESTSEIRPIITEEVRSKTPVIETKVVNDQVKMPPCATKIGKVSENSISECWPEEVSYIESNSLPFRNYSPYVARPLDSNAYRILRLRVEPGERLSFRLQGESSKVVMEALIPAPESNLAWRNALQQANFPPPQVRQSRLEISNPTEEPRNFDLILFGVHGYAYRVEVVRKQS
jgi:hypothetical protein